jgi:cell shape-determining protein MreC
MMGRPFQFSYRGEVMTLLACVALSLTLLILPEDTRILVADRLGRVLTAPYWNVRNFGQDVIDTHDENARLKEQLVQLELLTYTSERMQRDADRMAGLAIDPGYDGELLACRVVMRQRSRFATMLKIVSITPADWRPWQPVISRSGYLGRLRSVLNDREAWVELMASPDFALGVEFDRTGLLGVLRPRAEKFVVEMVGRDADVRVGDRVITSGIAEIKEGRPESAQGGLTARGLIVGTVVEVSSPSDQIFKEIMVEPAASFDFNSTVYVVTPLAGHPGAAQEGGR